MKTLREYFDEKWMGEPMSGCWLWTAAVNKQGYGLIGVRSRSTLAHRISWELHRGPIPDGLCVCHRCDNTYCVNPDHLFTGTQADNLMDMASKRRSRDSRGEKSGKAKLTDDQVLEIRRLYAQGGILQRELAARFGVSGPRVSDIILRNGWTHL